MVNVLIQLELKDENLSNLHYPPITNQIRDYSRSLVRQTKKGARRSTWEEIKYRVSICDTCSKLDKKSARCYQCGCPILKKVVNWDETCPLGKWNQIGMGLLENGLENSLTGLNAILCDSTSTAKGYGEYDVVISSSDPKADIFIFFDKKSIEECLFDLEDLGMVFAPVVFKKEIGERPFTFYFQPNFDFDAKRFFIQDTVYFGNLENNMDSHGNAGGSHSIFPAISFCKYLGIQYVDICIQDYGPQEDWEKFNLRLKDLIQLDKLEINELNANSPFSHLEFKAPKSATKVSNNLEAIINK